MSLWTDTPIKDDKKFATIQWFAKKYDEYIAKGGSTVFDPETNASMLKDILKHRAKLQIQMDEYGNTPH